MKMFQVQELDANLIEGTTTCDMDDEIVKQNSLFITDLSVVEDQARTYNVITGQGTPQGAWTFGELMKNMAGGYADEANPSTTEVTQVREFIKQWIVSLYSQFTVNNITSPHIDATQVIKPIAYQWLYKAYDDLGMSEVNFAHTNLDTVSWIEYLDSLTTAEQMNTFLSVAPFKLTAIVNRIDLRGNTAYNPDNGVNAGETRFIFSLIQTKENFGPDNGLNNQGKPIRYYSTGAHGGGGALMDWDGMNVILEYSNIAGSECSIKSLGEQWKALSEDTLGTDTYLNNLQAITDLVTTRNANPNGINGSAISQVRTNTKLFNNNPDHARWSLREFTLNETTGFLKNSPTKNMPLGNIRRNSKHLANQAIGASSEQTVDWVYDNMGRRVSVMAGNHNLPNNRLAPTSSMSDEMQSYYALGFWHQDFPDDVYDDDNYNQAASPDDKEIRHQLSLNSCMGCHGAETKTLFTMVRPLGYGQAADYWSTTPSTSTGLISNALSTIDNAGTTDAPNHPDANALGFIDNYNKEYYESIDNQDFRSVPNVSPFLTGRNYRGTALGLDERWEDDQEDPDHQDETNQDIGDKTTEGLFYVNDPSNEGNVEHDTYHSPNLNWDDAPFPKVHTKKYGYNELENRLMDLCLLVENPCNSGSGNGTGEVFTLVSTIGFVPLPLHGH